MRETGLVIGQVPRQWLRNGTFFKTKGRPPKNVSVSSSGYSVDGAVLMPVDGMGGAGRPSKLAVKRKQRKFIGKTLDRPKKVLPFHRHGKSFESAAGDRTKCSNY